jgi:hypothetical protein
MARATALKIQIPMEQDEQKGNFSLHLSTGAQVSFFWPFHQLELTLHWLMM